MKLPSNDRINNLFLRVVIIVHLPIVNCLCVSQQSPVLLTNVPNGQKGGGEEVLVQTEDSSRHVLSEKRKGVEYVGMRLES